MGDKMLKVKFSKVNKFFLNLCRPKYEIKGYY